MRPLYTRKVLDTTPKARTEHRKLVLRRLWWDWSDDLGFFLWCIVGIMIGIGATLIYGMWPR